MSDYDCQWRCASPGDYDSSHECKTCGASHIESIDNPSTSLEKVECQSPTMTPHDITLRERVDELEDENMRLNMRLRELETSREVLDKGFLSMRDRALDLHLQLMSSKERIRGLEEKNAELVKLVGEAYFEGWDDSDNFGGENKFDTASHFWLDSVSKTKCAVIAGEVLEQPR